MQICPCGSEKPFSICCDPYLKNTKHAESPEVLMRSRYTAYTLADIAYIQKTMRGKASKNYDLKSAYLWASTVTWLGLDVLQASSIKKDRGTVTFTATFIDKGVEKQIHEKSVFKKIGGEWFYVDGDSYFRSR